MCAVGLARLKSTAIKLQVMQKFGQRKITNALNLPIKTGGC